MKFFKGKNFFKENFSNEEPLGSDVGSIPALGVSSLATLATPRAGQKLIASGRSGHFGEGCADLGAETPLTSELLGQNGPNFSGIGS